MSEGKMREEFEAWYRESCAYAGATAKLAAWAAWKASRTALEIEMPAVEAWINDGRLDREKDEDADECIGLAPLCDVRAAIEAVGVGVK